jgi:hypothetical protein
MVGHPEVETFAKDELRDLNDTLRSIQESISPRRR